VVWEDGGREAPSYPIRAGVMATTLATRVTKRTNVTARKWPTTRLVTFSSVNVGTLPAIERGESSPSLGTVVKIAAAFGVKARELLDGVEGW
jgi:transcriptional regulator with XRE-family HTH domain